jgi:hypothetical protein
MAHSGYSVSSAGIGYMSGSSATTAGNNGVFQLLITPDQGYVVAAADFYIGDPYDGTKVNSVTFADSQYGANHAQNFVVVTVTLQSTYIVNANETIYIDIDGKANSVITSTKVVACLREQIQTEGSCPTNYWPMSGGPISPGMTTVPGLECLSCFIETENGTGVGTTSLASNTNWPNPLLSLQAYSMSTGIDNADVTDYTVDHIPGTPTVLFTKTFWTGPKNDFLVTPFYELNSLAVSSGDYIIEETQDNYNVDKTLLSQVNNSHIIPIDTTDILPGMQVTGSTLVTCSYDPVSNPTPTNICWPGFGMDIRVVNVDHNNNQVYLSESITSLSTGDILNFSTISYSDMGSGYITGGRVVAKKFTVKYNGSASVACGDHVINWAHMSGYTELANQGTQPKIFSTNIDTSDLSTNGDTRRIQINGTKNLATFSINITRQSDFKSYDFTTESFTAAASDLIDQTVDSKGYYSTNIVFPQSSVDDVYDVTITPKTVEDKAYLTTVLNTGVSSTFQINQYISKTVTLTTDATTAGLTLAAGLTGLTMSGQPGTVRRIKTPSWTGTITKSGGEVLYINRNPQPCKITLTDSSGGDFNFNTTSTTDGADNGTEARLIPTITGAGTATLTATITGYLQKIGTKNTTITFDLDNFVTIRPSVPDVGGGRGDEEESGDGGNPKKGAGNALTISLSSESQLLDIDVRSFDNDTNASSKTLSTVTNPKKGTLSAYGASGSAWDNGRIRYTRNEDLVVEPGDTDSFVYKATVSAADSDAAGQGTITITFTK